MEHPFKGFTADSDGEGDTDDDSMVVYHRRGMGSNHIGCADMKRLMVAATGMMLLVVWVTHSTIPLLFLRYPCLGALYAVGHARNVPCLLPGQG